MIRQVWHCFCQLPYYLGNIVVGLNELHKFSSIWFNHSFIIHPINKAYYEKSIAVCCSLYICYGCFGQSKLISYDDLGYLLRNNINKADTFFEAKGYSLVEKNINKKTRKYSLKLEDGTYANFNLRNDGKRMYVEIETNAPEQYNLIYNSISQYINKQTSTAEIQTFDVKDLGSIYIMTDDTTPYNPLRRTYTMQVVSDKSITAYN